MTDGESLKRALKDIERELEAAQEAGDFVRCQALIAEHARLTDPVYAAALSRTNAPSLPASPERRVRRSTQTPSLIPSSAAVPYRWGPGVRGIPNELARTGLFSTRRNSERAIYDNVLIAGARDTRVTYTGDELRIKDEDVLMQVYHYQVNRPLGVPWSVSGLEFLRALGATTGARGYQELYQSLDRLARGRITIVRLGEKRGDFRFDAGHLLAHLVIDHETKGNQAIRITISEDSLRLWESAGFTLVSWEQRLSLGSPLARFLHRYYSTHAAPFKLKVATLYELSGSDVARPRKFREQLRTQLQALVDVGFLTSFSISDSDIVSVQRASDPPPPALRSES